MILPFRVDAAGPVRIPLTQIAPVCRSVGRLVVDAKRGANRFRFNGRVDRRPLPDGTYSATTPTGPVRFAIVDGKPTRNPKRLAASVCSAPPLVVDGLRSDVELGGVAPTTLPPSATPPAATAPPAGLPALPEVLGRSLTEAVEAATSLHPAFYVLLALAIAALLAATMPARVMPVAAAGAALARRRAELTLAGTLSLLTVIVAYWMTLA